MCQKAHTWEKQDAAPLTIETESYEQSSEQNEPEVIEAVDELEVVPALIEAPVPEVTSPPPGLIPNTVLLCLLFLS